MTAKERLLEKTPNLTEVQAEAALRVVEAQIELSEYFEAEAKLSQEGLEAREDRLAKANAREILRDESW